MLIRVDGSNGCKTVDMHKRACASAEHEQYILDSRNLIYLMRATAVLLRCIFGLLEISIGESASCSVAFEVHQKSAIPCTRSSKERDSSFR